MNAYEIECLMLYSNYRSCMLMSVEYCLKDRIGGQGLTLVVQLQMYLVSARNALATETSYPLIIMTQQLCVTLAPTDRCNARSLQHLCANVTKRKDSWEDAPRQIMEIFFS